MKKCEQPLQRKSKVKIPLARFGLASMIVLVLAQSALAEPLTGRVGSSDRWGSGWIDLKKVTDLKKGDKVKLRIGGTANQILVRFLAKDEDPNDSVGIEGGIIEVPKSRVVQITLEDDHERTVQISVHGGPNPWNLYPMKGGNGPAKLLSAERIK